MPNEFIFRIIFIMVAICLLFIRIYYARQAGKSPGERRDSKVGATVLQCLTLLSFIGSFIYMLTPQFLRWSALPMPVWLRGIGAAFSIIAVPLLLWTHHALGKNWDFYVVIKTEHSLVTSGPYRWIRHPMYTCLVLMAFGFLLLTANWFIGISWFAVSLLGVARTGKEEKALIKRFSDEYREYMKRTGRFLPRWIR